MDLKTDQYRTIDLTLDSLNLEEILLLAKKKRIEFIENNFLDFLYEFSK